MNISELLSKNTNTEDLQFYKLNIEVNGKKRAIVMKCLPVSSLMEELGNDPTITIPKNVEAKLTFEKVSK